MNRSYNRSYKMILRTGRAAAALALIALSLVLCCCQERVGEKSPPQRAAPSGKIDMEYWRLSNECAEAAAKFWKLAGYHDNQVGAEYTNHFNSQLGKCLIRLRTMNKIANGIDESDTIYDAVEHVELMSLFTSLNSKTGATTAILHRDGQPVPDAPENRARMGALMEQPRGPGPKDRRQGP
jgi:hypothetical protein